jgi:predicted phosphodiesterase
MVSDIHGRDMKDVKMEFAARKVDCGICLGDFDRAHLARKMKVTQETNKLPWYVVPGNHDDSHVNRVSITSGTMDKQHITSEMMWAEWSLPENRDARDYVEKLLYDSRTIDFDIGGQKAIIIHGALAGYVETEPTELWARLKTDSDHKKNFAEMEKGGYQIMIRGHDHRPRYTCTGFLGGVKTCDGTEGKTFRLPKGKKHTISLGGYFEGHFAIIDTDVPGEKCPVLTYCKL